MSYRYFLAMRAWHQARRLWVKAHPDPDAAISALHPEWSEQRLLGAMYGTRERTR